jgi:hypothetical protein
MLKVMRTMEEVKMMSSKEIHIVQKMPPTVLKEKIQRKQKQLVSFWMTWKTYYIDDCLERGRVV